MSNRRRIFIVVVLAISFGITLYLRDRGTGETNTPAEPTVAELPRLLDLGSDKCIPCKTMAPMLEKLEADFAGKMDVAFIDVWKERSISHKFDVKIIPTQIFFAADGTELFRHEGFYSREEILDQWALLGYKFEPNILPNTAPNTQTVQ